MSTSCETRRFVLPSSSSSCFDVCLRFRFRFLPAAPTGMAKTTPCWHRLQSLRKQAHCMLGTDRRCQQTEPWAKNWDKIGKLVSTEKFENHVCVQFSWALCILFIQLTSTGARTSRPACRSVDSLPCHVTGLAAGLVSIFGWMMYHKAMHVSSHMHLLSWFSKQTSRITEAGNNKIKKQLYRHCQIYAPTCTVTTHCPLIWVSVQMVQITS